MKLVSIIFYPEPQPILCKYSESRAQRQMKTQFSNLAMPRRLLYYENIVKAERRDK